MKSIFSRPLRIISCGILLIGLIGVLMKMLSLKQKYSESSEEITIDTNIVMPAPAPAREINTIPYDPCIFGVVYYSYYSASENKTHYSIAFGNIISKDSLTTQEQEKMLSSLAENCGPVGANIIIEEKKIVYSDNRPYAKQQMSDFLQDPYMNKNH